MHAYEDIDACSHLHTKLVILLACACNAHIRSTLHILLCTASPHYEVPCNEQDGNEARAEDTTEPQHLQRDPAYCSIEMMKKTTVTYENAFQ